jgi:hypothetical protein
LSARTVHVNVYVSEHPNQSVDATRSQSKSSESPRHHHKEVICTTNRASVRANRQPHPGSAHKHHEVTTSPTKHIAQPHNTHLHPSNPQAQTKIPRPTRTSTPNTRKITTFQARTFRAPLNYKWKFWSVSLTRRSIKAHPADYPSCLVSSQATGSRGDET